MNNAIFVLGLVLGGIGYSLVTSIAGTHWLIFAGIFIAQLGIMCVCLSSDSRA